MALWAQDQNVHQVELAHDTPTRTESHRGAGRTKQATGNLNKFTNETYIACKLINVKKQNMQRQNKTSAALKPLNGRKQAVVYTFRLVVSLHIERGHKMKIFELFGWADFGAGHEDNHENEDEIGPCPPPWVCPRRFVR